MPSASLCALRRIGRRGVAAVEFGLIAPVLLLILLAGTDLVTTLRAQMRIETAATQLGQLASQCERVVIPGDTRLLFGHAQRMIGNLGQVTGETATGGVIMTAVYQVSGTNRVAWQQRAGLATYVSSVGTNVRNSPATLASNLLVPPGQTLIVTEIFLPRNSWVLSSGLMGGPDVKVLQATRLLLTRAPDAETVAQAPASSETPACLS